MNNLFLPLLLAAITATSCKNTGATVAGTGDTTSAGPVETRPPNSAYKPAFEGQTRVKGVKTSTAYTAKVISSDLKKPWGIAAMPDGRLLITEKGGTMRIAATGGQLSEPITGLLPVDDAGQGGLLDLALDPQFATNRMVYWTFSHRTGGGNLTAVAKGALAADEKTIQNAAIIYQATPAYDGDKHFGSRLVFDREGNIFLSTGERSDLETRPQAQDKASGLGKIIRITTDGRPAAAGAVSSSRPEIYSYGQRNPQGLAIHPETGPCGKPRWDPAAATRSTSLRPVKTTAGPPSPTASSMAARRWERASRSRRGWSSRCTTGTRCCHPAAWRSTAARGCRSGRATSLSAASTASTLPASCSRGTKVVGEERLLATEGQHFRDITQGGDGWLYAVTDGGRLYRIGK